MDSDIEDTEYDPDDDLAVDSPSEDYGKNGTLSWLPSFQNIGKSKEKWNLKGIFSDWTVAIVVGCLLLVGLIKAAIIYFLCIRKRNASQQQHTS